MRTTCHFAWICVLSAAATASAAPIVDVGSHPLLGSTAGQTIQLWVTGDGNLAGLNLFVQVGDGGPELVGYGLPAGTDGPSIAGVNLQPMGGIFTGRGAQTDSNGIPQVVISTFDVTNGAVNANGLLVELTIDTTGFSSGSWPLMLKGVLPFSSLGGPYDTAGVGAGGQTVPFGITNGSIIIPGTTGWNASSGSWSDSNCWSAGEPNAGLRANITNGGIATISQTGRSCSIVTLGSSPGPSTRPCRWPLI